jgi:hypothetical protein
MLRSHGDRNFWSVIFAGVPYGYNTVDGSGIAEHPYHDVYGGAPGAFAPASASGRDEFFVPDR